MGPLLAPSKDPTFTPLIYIQVLRTDYVTIPENKRDDTSFKTQYGQQTYQLQSTPTGNFNPLATEKEEQRNRRRKEKVCQLQPLYYCSRTPSINLS
ncbi:hypothetical protein Avbf_15527 [Armadillidium vulgare]|nr:hypothetical protein Avbf_15527 [Armadillidium vulgare]